MKFELKHTFDAPVDAVMDAMSDPAFPDFMKSHMKLMSDIRPIDRKEEGGRLSWRLRCVPVPMIKKVGPKEVPPEALAFVQESTIDRAGKRITFKNVAEHPKVLKHLENSGSFSFRDLGGRTERVITRRAARDEPAVPAQAARRDRRAHHLLERRGPPERGGQGVRRVPQDPHQARRVGEGACGSAHGAAPRICGTLCRAAAVA